MAKRKKAPGSVKRRPPSRGAMSGLRSGFKGMVGGGRKSKGKGETDFITVLFYMLLVALAVVLLSRVL